MIRRLLPIVRWISPQNSAIILAPPQHAQEPRSLEDENGDDGSTKERTDVKDVIARFVA